MSTLLRLSGIGKSYAGVAAVQPTDLEVGYGDFAAILGPSGCGKSTLLRMIAGFVEPTTGRIEIDGIDVTRLGPEKRPTNMVFQGYGLFPHLDVGQNVAFGLRLRRLPDEEIARRAEEALRLVRLEGFESRAIDRLSGGQQQRVALARALIMRPKVLLLDEPLAALDLKLRHAMQDELRRIHQEIGGTFLFVTHDQGEAFALADHVVVMNAGRIEQVGTPEAVYRRPASFFVADFVGETNSLAGERRAGIVTLGAGASFASSGENGAVRVVVRPEMIRIGSGDGNCLDAVVSDIIFLGNAVKVEGRLASGEMITVRCAADAPLSFGRGDTVRLSWAPADQQVMDSKP